MHNAALELFNDRLPHKPYFSDDLNFGVRIAGKERAILAKYIQFNQPHAMFWLGFDVDRAGAAIDWSDRNAPAPTLSITNPCQQPDFTPGRTRQAAPADLRHRHDALGRSHRALEL